MFSAAALERLTDEIFSDLVDDGDDKVTCTGQASQQESGAADAVLEDDEDDEDDDPELSETRKQ